MTARITNDASIERALTVFADGHRGSPGLVLELKDGLAEALTEAFDVERDIPSKHADLARSAIDLLAADKQYSGEVQALLSGPAPERFAVVEGALVVTSALVVLQTHVRFERKENGKWTVRIEKKPTDTALLKTLVSKLLAFMR